MITDYSYADYSKLSEDQQLLWWFDEYLRYDLIFINIIKEYSYANFKQLAILVERHTIYNFAWADNYSYYLWRLASYTDAFLSEGVNLVSANCEFTIPAGKSERIVITYLVPDTHTTMIERMKKEYGNNAIPNIPTTNLTKHQFFCKTGTQPVKVVLNNCYKYSVVVNAEDTAFIEAVIPPEYLYKNIAQWEAQFNPPPSHPFSIVNQSVDWTLSGFQTIYTNTPPSDEDLIDAGKSLPTFTDDGIVINRILTPYDVSVTNLTFSYASVSSCRLIYANPPDNLFPTTFGVSIFKKNSNLNNLSFGALFDNVALPDLIFANAIMPNNLLGSTLDGMSLTSFTRTDVIGETPFVVPSGTTAGPGYTFLSYEYQDYDLNAVSAWGFPFIYKGVVQWDDANGLGVHPFIASGGEVYDANGRLEKVDVYTYSYTNRNWFIWTNGQITTYSAVIGVIGYNYSVSVAWQNNPQKNPTENYNLSENLQEAKNQYELLTIAKAVELLNKLVVQTATIKASTDNLLEIFEGFDADGSSIYTINENYIEEYVMGLELMVQEIHACLGAGEFAYQNNGVDEPSPAYMNIARRLDYTAKAVGVYFDLSGRILGVRQSRHLEQGETIPRGWNLGQFGRNEGGRTDGQKGGNDDEERLGIVYDVRGNKFRTNAATGEPEITEGGYVLCESIPQYIAVMLADIDRSLGLQQLGSYAVANPNYNPDVNDEDCKNQYYQYNGLAKLITEIAYTLADTHKQASLANIGSLKGQAISQEILAALGVPLTEKIVIVGKGMDARMVVHPGFNAEGTTVADLLFWVLSNIAYLMQGSVEIISKES